MNTHCHSARRQLKDTGSRRALTMCRVLGHRLRCLSFSAVHQPGVPLPSFSCSSLEASTYPAQLSSALMVKLHLNAPEKVPFPLLYCPSTLCKLSAWPQPNLRGFTAHLPASVLCMSPLGPGTKFFWILGSSEDRFLPVR